jgi:probable addiction module antidote protein
MGEKFSRFDAAEYLETEDDIAGFLEESAASGDPAVMLHAIATAVRARNMSAMAKQIGMTREGLYKALAPTGNPSFANVDRIVKALGFQVALVRVKPPSRRPFGAMATMRQRPAAKRVETKKPAPGKQPHTGLAGVKKLAAKKTSVAKAIPANATKPAPRKATNPRTAVHA